MCLDFAQLVVVIFEILKRELENYLEIRVELAHRLQQILRPTTPDHLLVSL